VAAAVGLAMIALPVGAQHASGHSSASGVGPVRSMPGRSFNAPMHGNPGLGITPLSSGRPFGGIRANSLGANSAPSPSWELPKYVTPHWEIGPNVRIQPNPVQGNPLHHGGSWYGGGHRGWHHAYRGLNGGVGYAALPFYGLPYGVGYIDPLAMAESDMMDDDTGQQAQPAPARQQYAPQPPYAESPDEGYPPPRAPYNPETSSAPAPQNNATENAAPATDGLDHPAITLVFKDRRPPEKVRSYALTGSSIFIAEPGHQRTIPIADLDLPATIEQNREAGVDFQLPGNSQ
jgi:hypothetical protein